MEAILPGMKWRYNETSHYYTKNGIEVEVLKDGVWLEVLECGETLPELLDDNGLDSNNYNFLALGLGLDRLVMFRKNISDIRLLRHPDPRIAKQMLHLEPYKEVSVYPAVKKDIFIAVLNETDDELLGDMIRNFYKKSIMDRRIKN